MDCGICLCELPQDNDLIVQENNCVVLKCNHSFHKDCIREWINKGSRSCPYCRAIINYNFNDRIVVKNAGNLPLTVELYIPRTCLDNNHSVSVSRVFGVVTKCQTCLYTNCFGYIG